MHSNYPLRGESGFHQVLARLERRVHKNHVRGAPYLSGLPPRLDQRPRWRWRWRRCWLQFVYNVLGWLARVSSRFGSLLVWLAGCHHDVSRWPLYFFMTTSGIGIWYIYDWLTVSPWFLQLQGQYADCVNHQQQQPPLTVSKADTGRSNVRRTSPLVESFVLYSH